MSDDNGHQQDEAWAAIARPATAAEYAAEDAAHAREVDMIFAQWGFPPPRLARRWPTDGGPPAGSFEARERDIADATDAYLHADDLLHFRFTP